LPAVVPIFVFVSSVATVLAARNDSITSMPSGNVGVAPSGFVDMRWKPRKMRASLQ
jgi:hypothetical protein